VRALSNAHAQGLGEPGKNGKPAGYGNYTFAQLRRKTAILKAAGFLKYERLQLIKSGIVGIGRCGGGSQRPDGMFENFFLERQRLSSGPKYEVFSYSRTHEPVPVNSQWFAPKVITVQQPKEAALENLQRVMAENASKAQKYAEQFGGSGPRVVNRRVESDPVGGTLTPFKDWTHGVDLGASSNTATASGPKTQTIGGMGGGTSRTGVNSVSDGALAFSQWQDRMNRGGMGASYTAPRAQDVQATSDTSPPLPQNNMGVANNFSTAGARTRTGQGFTGPQVNTTSFGNNTLGKTPTLAQGGSTTVVGNQAMQPGQQRLSQMMASSKLGVKSTLIAKPYSGTRPGHLQLKASMDEKAKQKAIQRIIQQVKAKKSRETARATVLPAVVDGHPRGEFQPMTKNGVLAGWVRKEKGRYAYYDVHGNRKYGYKKPKFKKMNTVTEPGVGEVILPRGTTKVVAARTWLPDRVGGEPKFKLKPVWRGEEVAGWKHDVSGVTKYYDLSGRSTGQDEITISGTMPPWEYAGLAAGGVKVAAKKVAKPAAEGLGAIYGAVKNGAGKLKALFGGARIGGKKVGALVADDAVKPVVKFGGRASKSGGEILEGATWDQTPAARAINRWLGNDVRVVTNPAGDTIFLSKDGLRRVRFDIKRPSPHNSPHTHVEEFVNGKWRKSGPIYPTDVPHN
jgi:hypothetical protein